MKLESIMTKKVYSLKEHHTILDACNLMKSKNVGCIPIIDDNNRLRGIITDRDIILGIAKGLPINEKLDSIMTKKVFTLYPSDTIVDLTEMMGYYQIRRVPIINYDDKLIGIISLGDLSLMTFTDNLASEALAEISYNPTNPDLRSYLYD